MSGTLTNTVNSATDSSTGAAVVAPPPPPPTIAGTVANQQVVQGATIHPFSNVTITDPNPNPLVGSDSMLAELDFSRGPITSGAEMYDNPFTISGPDLGRISDVGGFQVYADNAADLQSDLRAITFVGPAAGTAPAVTPVTLQVYDDADSEFTTDTTTSIDTVPPPTPVITNPGPTPTATLPVPTNPTPTPVPVVVQPAPNPIALMYDTTTGVADNTEGQAYSGPVDYLQYQLIAPITQDNLAITAMKSNIFLKGSNGNDALNVNGVGGQNVLDGGTGSNYLVGGSDPSQQDTFFLDDTNVSAGNSWSTIVNFHAGDFATVWGVSASDFANNGTWNDGQGATGATGLTLVISQPNQPNASLTLSGFSKGDLADGKITTAFGNVGGRDYMLVSNNFNS